MLCFIRVSTDLSCLRMQTLVGVERPVSVTKESPPMYFVTLVVLGMKIGDMLAEGKTKQIFEVVGDLSMVVVRSKDQITANNATKKNDMEGKAAISNDTTCHIFEFLKAVGLGKLMKVVYYLTVLFSIYLRNSLATSTIVGLGINNHFVSRNDSTSFIAARCYMIPIEWVTRRVATGSFLKRNPGVSEGYRFAPVKMETFFKVRGAICCVPSADQFCSLVNGCGQ